MARGETIRPFNWHILNEEPHIPDNGGDSVSDPDSQVNQPEDHVLVVCLDFRFVVLRMKYNAMVLNVTSPIIQPFGKRPGEQIWQPLMNLRNEHEVALVARPDHDSGSSGYLHTRGEVIALHGCVRLLVGVKTPFAATGTVNDSQIEGLARI